MNKIASQRYPSHTQLYRSPKSIDNKNIKNINHSHAVVLLTKKQSHIDMLKRRISALCVKQEKVNHKTINNQKKWQQKYKVKQQSNQIKLLLQNQRKRDAQRVQSLKNRNLQTRVDKYYRSITFKKNQLQKKKQQTKLQRTKSRQYDSLIHKRRQEDLKVNKNKKEEVNRSEKSAKSERSRVIIQRQKSLQQTQKRQVEHLLNLGNLKDNQLSKLGELQLMMVEKHTSSKLAYDASIERLKKFQIHRKTSNYYRPSQVIRSARQKAQRVDYSLRP